MIEYLWVPMTTEKMGPSFAVKTFSLGNLVNLFIKNEYYFVVHV
jgi:hypothetical protein